MSNSQRRRTRRLHQLVADTFDPEALQRICEMPETEFAEAFGLTVTGTPKPAGGFYAFRDNGASVLAVAHLDTVADADERQCRFLDTAAGPVVFSRALDDRLGAYVILELLPQLGITADILLTVGEEQGQSTAQFFDPIKDYDWMFEFDRGGTDVVAYQYDDDDLRDRVEAASARMGIGSYSDIAYLDHLGCQGVNWGVGYAEYHSARSHAFLDDTFRMVAKFLTFHEQNEGVFLEYVEKPPRGLPAWMFSSRYDDDAIEGEIPRHLLWDDDNDTDVGHLLRDSDNVGTTTDQVPTSVAEVLEGSW